MHACVAARPFRRPVPFFCSSLSPVADPWGWLCRWHRVLGTHPLNPSPLPLTAASIDSTCTCACRIGALAARFEPGCRPNPCCTAPKEQMPLHAHDRCQVWVWVDGAHKHVRICVSANNNGCLKLARLPSCRSSQRRSQQSLPLHVPIAVCLPD